MTPKSCLAFLLAILLSACQSTPAKKDIYSATVKETISGDVVVEVKSRLELSAKQKTLELAKKNCHEKNKMRVLIANQETEYTHGSQSEYKTGYHTATTSIKCK